MIRYLFILILCVSASNKVFSQNILVKYLKYTLMDTSPPAKPKFIAYPTLAFTPETSWEIGISGLLVYRAKQDTTNRLSELKTFSFVTLAQQYGTVLEHALYTDKNKFFFLGEMRFQNFPLTYFGIGPETKFEENVIVNTREFRFRERVLNQIAPSIFTGFEVDFQRLSRVHFEWDGNQQTIGIPRGNQGSANLSLGWGLLYDNIHNVLNPRHGKYMEVAYLASKKAWGSTYSFDTWFADFRFYNPVGKRNVLATQVYGQFGNGDVPFNALALMGGERLMRGYYLGRYRDKKLMAGQVEYRMLPFPFAKRWGLAAFAAAGSVFPDFETYTDNPLRWAAGAGPRFLLFPNKDVYNRLDVAFTSEGMGFYFHIGESF
jgi:hypothetical protein